MLQTNGELTRWLSLLDFDWVGLGVVMAAVRLYVSYSWYGWDRGR